jgi:hypothetical protein
MLMAFKYNTGVSGGFLQAGNNVALSRALPSVGTLPLIHPGGVFGGK